MKVHTWGGSSGLLKPAGNPSPGYGSGCNISIGDLPLPWATCPLLLGVLKHRTLQGHHRFCAILLGKPSDQNISAQSCISGRKSGSTSRAQTGRKNGLGNVGLISNLKPTNTVEILEIYPRGTRLPGAAGRSHTGDPLQHPGFPLLFCHPGRGWEVLSTALSVQH